MITGIPVKIKHETEHGTDCETVYFATYRKCPALAARTKKIAQLEVDIKTAETVKRLAEKAMETADTEEVILKASESISKMLDKSMFAQDAIIEEFELFALDGFKAAGYDHENAARIAQAIPLSRMGELVAAARVGSGVVDFFADKLPPGGS